MPRRKCWVPCALTSIWSSNPESIVLGRICGYPRGSRRGGTGGESASSSSSSSGTPVRSKISLIAGDGMALLTAALELGDEADEEVHAEDDEGVWLAERREVRLAERREARTGLLLPMFRAATLSCNCPISLDSAEPLSRYAAEPSASDRGEDTLSDGRPRWDERPLDLARDWLSSAGLAYLEAEGG